MKESKEKRAQQIEAARTLYASGFKLTQIAEKLGIPDGTVRSWKNRGMLGEENATLNCNVAKNATKTLQRKRGGQPGNHNASGPPGNQHAVKYGFFSKMLPAETMDLINEIDQVSPISCNGGIGKTNVVTKGGNITTIFDPEYARFQNPYPVYMNLNGAWAVYENVPAGSTVSFDISISKPKSNYDTYYAVYGVE